ncbi:hypothetical protein CIB95_14875 [Lottiidibacillus patelloidae]|uniref:Putative hemin transport system permease protein HrtB n=1 Tax=Lottiidibacillus patelloidae TaxID=2670334 RepID=A0A263BQF7_9BACI|nr:ABC transporter permease [Lottiidibacillus patelloidae]OZM55944.1 hypothetical protein CIB95_14875 [Lottiidibacillus patelloidae]
MNIIKFSLKSILGRKTNTIFTAIAIMIAAALVFSVMMIFEGLDKGIKDQAGSYDIVVGAEGSPMQLTLNSLLYFDKPLGNVPYSLYEELRDDERVLRVVPIALGDSYESYPVIGTTLEFFQPFREGLQERFSLAEGSYFKSTYEVVIGASVARELDLQVGDHFHSSHGFEGNNEHDEMEYIVTGILEPVGSADDKGIFTSIESVWHAHEEETGEEAHTEEHEDEKEVTAILVKPQMLGFAPGLKEEIDKKNEMQAVYPVIMFRQLLETFSIGKQIAMLLATISIFMAVLFIVFAVLGSMNQRRGETMILRSLGVPRYKIATNILIEMSFVSLIGTSMGYFLSQTIVFLVGTYSKMYLGFAMPTFIISSNIIYVGVSIFLLALIISFIPTLFLFNRDIGRKQA